LDYGSRKIDRHHQSVPADVHTGKTKLSESGQVHTALSIAIGELKVVAASGWLTAVAAPENWITS
jgi:hypothetical protein